MKLEVGMYVRTEKGKIDKIIGFDGALILFLSHEQYEANCYKIGE